ncbi:AFG1-like ATPase [Neoconidiobolus thromboides FSU 785]|nr:AFG1-like ATPase [Neoconidiobolus thromboides FSU 785]
MNNYYCNYNNYYNYIFILGTGKTMLMELFYDSLPTTLPKRRVHFHAFMIEIHERIHQIKKNKKIRDPIPPIIMELSKNAKILCFDELQVTDIADAMILRRIFDELFKNNVTIIITSNRHPNELYKDGIQRQSFIPCIELLKQKLNVIDLNSGLDYRRQVTEKNELYLSPINEINEFKFDVLFKEFLNGKQAKQEKLHFLGRELIVPYANNGVAKFTFEELCVQPLNAADYLKLSEKYHSVFLSNIPYIYQCDRNIIRRFITLIDALYENKNTLICLSIDKTELLFQPKGNNNLVGESQDNKDSSNSVVDEETFALQRTYSRVVQMQSINWVTMNSQAPNSVKRQISSIDL